MLDNIVVLARTVDLAVILFAGCKESAVGPPESLWCMAVTIAELDGLRAASQLAEDVGSGNRTGAFPFDPDYPVVGLIIVMDLLSEAYSSDVVAGLQRGVRERLVAP
ncbi:hypothetical protein GQX73_g8668 [Xylaria multiplex]|uniref:Uncharacterized protein n=1 Tax=Xylaria multiplex TaxID=323545 RepID=A0A7C8MKT6_9PEZI|nr:hypothetical protein GQX73_g8668 [Xylaria multiplex]